MSRSRCTSRARRAPPGAPAWSAVRASPPPHPAANTGAENGCRDESQRDPGNPALLGCRQGDASIRGFARPNRDEILLLRQPSHNGHEDVAIALNAEDSVRREVGITDDGQSRLGLRCVLVFWLRL